jgi:hypothetical protein
MPVPQPTSGQDEQEYISSCIREIIGEYDAEGQAYAVCKAEYDKMSVEEDIQQGGVVSPGSFGRTKFEYPAKSKESLNEFMGRCMGDSMVREKKKDRGVRAGFCYTQYQQRYIANIARGWK